MKIFLVLAICASIAAAQYGGPPPPGAWGGGNRPSSYPKQPQPHSGRPSPFSSIASGIPGSSSSSSNVPPSYDDPIPQIPHDSSYDSQTLPAKLPILAPNGVVEIYNRVVDDLIKRLEVDFEKKKMDPMPVLIRPTPAGPVRVPGYMQRRPFRRPGAALYRAGGPPLPAGLPPPSAQLKKKKTGRSNTAAASESRFPEGGRAPVGTTDEKSSSRGTGKISKTPISNEDFVPETTPSVVESVEEPVKNSTEAEAANSSEEGVFIRSRSDEYFPADDDDDDNKSSVVVVEKTKKTKKDDTAEDDDEDEKASDKHVDTMLARYEAKQSKKKPAKSSTKAKPAKAEKVSAPPSHSVEDDDDDDDDDEPEVRDDMEDDVSFDAEPGTGGGGRPQGGYYPPGGPPALPAKPNAWMTGLSKIRRASDVAVSVDARSAMITSRLLVGPINIQVNESVEPKERGIKATIPELEAEIILMERHGVVFLQRFTLDRAYGQDVEISIPKSKGSSNKKKGSAKNGPPGSPGYDPSGSPAAQDRYHTKMAAHISMEVVKLLRSGNLRVNLMRTAQGSMSKLKLPIQKPKTKKTKGKEKKDSTGKSSEKH